MSDMPRKPIDPVRHFLAASLIGGGVIILAAIAVFLWLALGFRHSVTSSLPLTEDLALGLAALSPFILLALLMIGYGRRLLRRE